MNSNTMPVPVPSPPVRRRSSRLLFLLTIFVCGIVVGAVGGGVWTRERMIAMMKHPEQLADRIVPKIRAELALDDDQSRKVEEIVRRRHALMESLRAETHPKQFAEFQAMRGDVANLLEPEQREKWSALCDRVEQSYMPARPSGPPPLDLLFYRFDANNDHALDQDETPPGVWRRLKMADQNGDGKVTPQEYSAALIDRAY